MNLEVRAGHITSKSELINLIHDVVDCSQEVRNSTILALRSIGFQMMMSGNSKSMIECIQEQFKLSDYARVLSLPSTQIASDYICLKLCDIVSLNHFAIEVFAGLYSNLIYYGEENFSKEEINLFKMYAKPASGGGPKPTFISIEDRIYTFATITGGVESSTEMSFRLIKEGKIVHILSGRHGQNMLGQLITNDNDDDGDGGSGLVHPEILEEDHFFKADLPMFQVNMENQMKHGKLFVENLENKAGPVQQERIKEILALGDNHVIILNWCVSLLCINEYTLDSVIQDIESTCEAYFGSLEKVHQNWKTYLS